MWSLASIHLSVCMLMHAVPKHILGPWGKRVNKSLEKLPDNIGGLNWSKKYKSRMCESGIKVKRKIGGYNFWCFANFRSLLSSFWSCKYVV